MGRGVVKERQAPANTCSPVTWRFNSCVFYLEDLLDLHEIASQESTVQNELGKSGGEQDASTNTAEEPVIVQELDTLNSWGDAVRIQDAAFLDGVFSRSPGLRKATLQVLILLEDCLQTLVVREKTSLGMTHADIKSPGNTFNISTMIRQWKVVPYGHCDPAGEGDSDGQRVEMSFPEKLEALPVPQLLNCMHDIVDWLFDLSPAFKPSTLAHISTHEEVEPILSRATTPRDINLYIAQAQEAFPEAEQHLVQRLGRACQDRAIWIDNVVFEHNATVVDEGDRIEASTLFQSPAGFQQGRPFKCLLCSTWLTSVRTRTQWIAHILRDIEPYICTASACRSGPERYSFFNTWGEHVVRSHYTRTAYRRSDSTCHVQFDTKTEYQRHLKVHACLGDKTASLMKARVKLPLCHSDCVFAAEYRGSLRASDRAEPHRQMALKMECLALNALPGSNLGHEWLQIYNSWERPRAWSDFLLGANAVEDVSDRRDNILWLCFDKHVKHLELVEGAQEPTSTPAYRPSRFALLCNAGDANEARLEFQRRPEDVTTVDEQGQNLLQKACINGHTSVAALLLEYGCPQNVEGDNEMSALEYAVDHGHEEIVRLLLDQAPSFDAEATALILESALWNGCASIVCRFLDTCPEVRQTTLHIASSARHREVVEVLLRRGADAGAADNRGDTPLHCAARFGRSECVEVLSPHYLNINIHNNDGQTALHLAAESGYEEVARMLLERGMDVNAADDRGMTALHASFAGGNIDLTRTLLDHGADIEAEERYGQTPLTLIAVRMQFAALELLLERGANVDAVDQDGHSVLHHFLRRANHRSRMHEEARKSNFERLQRLLDYGANPSLCDHKGYTPLMVAAEFNDIEKAQLLIDYGADIEAWDGTGRTALFVTIDAASGDVMRLLLEHGARTSLPVPYRKNALQEAVHRGYEAGVKLLLDHGVDIELADKINRFTPLHDAIKYEHAAIAKLLIVRGADSNTRGRTGRSALITAICHKLDDVASLLLAHGAHPEPKDIVYEAPIHFAARYGRTVIIEQLLEHGADVNIHGSHRFQRDQRYSVAKEVKDWIPLHRAVVYDKTTAVKCLLDHGANLQAKVGDGYSALHLAAIKGKKRMVKLLLDRGADASAKDDAGRTALHLAIEHRNHNAVKNLLRHGADIEAADLRGRRPLHVAAKEGNKRGMQLLLRHGADIDALDLDGRSPLTWAREEKRKDCEDVLQAASWKREWVVVDRRKPEDEDEDMGVESYGTG